MPLKEPPTYLYKVLDIPLLGAIDDISSLDALSYRISDTGANPLKA
jgi:hypothetical protein